MTLNIILLRAGATVSQALTLLRQLHPTEHLSYYLHWVLRPLAAM